MHILRINLWIIREFRKSVWKAEAYQIGNITGIQIIATKCVVFNNRDFVFGFFS